MAGKKCADPRCGKLLPLTLPGQQKYCNETCRRRKLERDAYARKKAVAQGVVPGRVSAAESADGRGTARRNEGYEDFVLEEWPLRILEFARDLPGGMSQAEIVVQTGLSKQNVARWFAAWQEDELARRRGEGWVMSLEHAAMLEPTAVAFASFRSAFFRDERGRAYMTPAVHLRWIEALLYALATGGRQIILSPPRHGKTDLLTHFGVWMIVRNPNIRIIWVGGNEDIAKNAVGAVLDQLESNADLVAAMLGPSGAFKPKGRGKPWTNKLLTVGTRTVTGLKSATVTALGKGGRLLSRDADVIVFDDIVDYESASMPSTRKKDVEWFTQDLASRKEEHTAMLGIGSRVHHGDIWGHLASNVAWRAIIEHAHDPACNLPTHGPIPAEEHETCAICAAHVDCLLFPELRSMRWLEDTRASAADDIRFEMIYQNITRADGAEWVTTEDLRRCRNSGRRIGELPVFDDGLAHDVRLVAGLDPAAKGFQASFLWAFDVLTQRRFMLDVDNRRAGGTEGARLILREWFERYGVRTWVVERNGYQEALLQDRDITDFCSLNGISLVPHYTDRHNKHDPDFGVTAQFGLFRRGLIDLPVGDAQSVDKVRLYEQQILNFEPDSSRAIHHQPSDVVMSAWFPEGQFRLWTGELVHMTMGDNRGYAASTIGGMAGGGDRSLSGWNREQVIPISQMPVPA